MMSPTLRFDFNISLLALSKHELLLLDLSYIAYNHHMLLQSCQSEDENERSEVCNDQIHLQGRNQLCERGDQKENINEKFKLIEQDNRNKSNDVILSIFYYIFLKIIRYCGTSEHDRTISQLYYFKEVCFDALIQGN